jgi:hypothetical protein
MGLDATVYCDCFEKGRLREPPPPGCKLAVAADGSLLCGSDQLEVMVAFDRWLQSRACEHQDGVLIHHRIGNAALIACLRSELQSKAVSFPMLLSNVAYSGIHSGDFISIRDLVEMRSEIDALASLHCENAEAEALLRTFERQMCELIETARAIDKPISF